MWSWLPDFGVLEWLHIHFDYLLAVLMVAGGVYVAIFFNLAAANPLAWLLRPLRYFGYGLIVAGVAFGYGTYRESKGAADCMAAWQGKNLELHIANLERDLKAQQAAAAASKQEAAALAAQKEKADGKINEWQAYAGTLSASLAAGRRATRDDDRRLCDLVGNAAAGCKPAR